MVQVLHISNGDTINQKLAAKGSRVEQLIAAKTPDDKIIEEAYLERPVTLADGRGRSSGSVAEIGESSGGGEDGAAIEDLYWSLLSGKEFLFNH